MEHESFEDWSWLQTVVRRADEQKGRALYKLGISLDGWALSDAVKRGWLAAQAEDDAERWAEAQYVDQCQYNPQPYELP